MAGIDAGLTDLALARVQIWSVVADAKVEDPNQACTIVEAMVRKCMREGAARESRQSQAAVSMAPRVWSRVVEGAAGDWRGRPWD